jgi:hypothetical protein
MVPLSRRIAALLLASAAVLACRTEPEETWGFVATLGNDTTSVERVTRKGNRITGDAVGRSPMVVRRRWEMTLAPDGSVERWTMDTHVPNAAAGQQELHHEIERGAGVIRMVRRAGRDSMDRTVREPAPTTVPWNAFLYATTEQLLRAASLVPDTARIGQYFFEGWAEGKLGFASVRRLADGRFSVTSTGLAGSGIAQVDDSGRMLSYDGHGTTYLQDVKRVSAVPDLDSLLGRFAAAEQEAGVRRALSARDTMRATAAGTDLTVEYSRPLRRGRTLVGGIIPYGRVWRTGANAATHLTISAPIRLAGVPLDAGTYTLWTLPTEEEVLLIINRQTGQWGTAYGAEHDIARVPMAVDTLATSVEPFTIGVDSASSRLFMAWGTFHWSVPIAARTSRGPR